MQESALIFISAFAALFLARKAAFRIGLVDKPNARKKHQGHIPLVGGVSIYLALWVLYVQHPDWLSGFSLYMICATALLVVGVLDDRFDLPVLPRVVLQAGVAALMMYAGFYLETLGHIFFGYELFLGIFGYIVTLLAVWGTINAFNMVDGIDGLLGALSCVSFGSLAIVFYLGGNHELALWCACLLTATLPYILLNLGILLGSSFKVFMGDAGSTLIGFTVIWLLMLATQGENAVIRPVTALWFIAIPIMDMVTVMTRRIRRGDSPFKPDREHLHHILMRIGLTPHQILIVILLVAMLSSTIGILGERVGIAESIMFSGFLMAFCGYFWMISQIWHVSTWFRRTERHSNSGVTNVGKNGSTLLKR
ncbi:UDP-N-acetylglucosamine--undecaprenyl-phosphate N-acetylglucosaminephosphotransferase [Pectobacterium aroidearum]|uniref:UDP-N-acetylglucosamine--undecaprenyl-phosphate N-acetylglucosaminephosphotransferase n=1 Tax=Pectobacterium aroidearum TaxID=1201031 RepID=UPI0021152BB4|nr:UDP-N-acetylglucosamine--undecaprenyl-phosphate N-acetylglucosaminephosphotransferase [Pectobacterium aroidearum]UUE47245.1 UDP-N-acetylglucosamine--undecaprenyl-phosphate N-acetylglucosaminephosphotransferase [Pectobacterium aroidearum]UUE51447.1 UDP-N-acetylglucosamine--undecaprenyl-phosphate N-acetylglucosaminephosphotransferase [Pectobacterium aroidearum]UUE55668.1 UDP-N-acetylglucosamine--undecaprenyl-phosphate N-acetylglucosaminephosphotransferase [Pectobacterium aroidearum]UUE64079.1 